MALLLAGLFLLPIFCAEGGDDDSSDYPVDDDDDETGDVKVYAANSQWTNSNVHAAYGDTLILFAAGEITIGEQGEMIGPDGNGQTCGLGCPAPDLPRGALAGKIVTGTKNAGGSPFLVGNEFESLVTDAGTVFLIVNDDTYADNDGYFSVDIQAVVADDDDDEELPEQCLPENFILEIIAIDYGTYAGFGQTYLPDNILGPPAGRGDFASQSGQNELISLGDGGSVTVKMGRTILNGPGVDFIIYENVYYWGANPDDAYTEAAVVDVSPDGQSWVRFPFDFVIDGPVGPHGVPDTVPENFVGFAGVQPSYGNCDPNGDGQFDDMIDPLDFEVSGGDGFDLEDVGLSEAAYIRITDTGHITRNPGSEMYDADGDLINDGGNLLDLFEGIQGFDLDAIAVVNGGEKLKPDEN